jgi:hypothetical protein
MNSDTYGPVCYVESSKANLRHGEPEGFGLKKAMQKLIPGSGACSTKGCGANFDILAHGLISNSSFSESHAETGEYNKEPLS